ncbi:MAG: EAL domain-containing protein [Acidimicrobiales bacterium]
MTSVPPPQPADAAHRPDAEHDASAPRDRLSASRGLRRLQAGLPIDHARDLRTADRAGTERMSAARFSVDLSAAIDTARQREEGVAVFRIRHRSLPEASTRLAGRLHLEPAVEARLLSVHAEIVAAPLDRSEIVAFVPGLRRRSDGEDLLASLVRMMSNPVDTDGTQHHLSPTIGVAVLDQDNPSAETLMDAAALALAETDASNPGMVFHPYHRVRHERQLELERDLRLAVLANETTVAVQPAIALGSGELRSVEVFTRWERPERGSVPALDVVNTAEELGLLHQLGRQGLERALFRAVDWIDGGLLPVGTTLWTNRTPTEIEHPEFASTMADAIAVDERVKIGIKVRPSVPPEHRHVHAVLRALVARGARAAIGDFGVGPIDLAKLHQLPYDAVMIDRSLVQSIGRGAQSGDVVGALMRLATLFGLEATATGVESLEQLETLCRLGVSNGQGYHIARPMTLDAFGTFLRARPSA